MMALRSFCLCAAHLADPSAARARVRAQRCGLALALWLAAAGTAGVAQGVPLLTRSEHALASTNAVDAGPLPGSQELSLTLRLAPNATQEAALDELLVDQTNPVSLQYHRWLSAAAYGAQFGATTEELSGLTGWLTGNGLLLVSATPTRVVFRGTAAQAAVAFATTMDRVRTAEGEWFANVSPATLPAGMLPGRTVTLSGLDDLPVATAQGLRLIASPALLNVRATEAQVTLPSQDTLQREAPGPASASTTGLSAIAALEAAVEADVTPVLALDSTLCASAFAPAEQAELRGVLRQGQAQGVAVLVSARCTTPDDVSFPSSLPTVTAVTLAPDAAATSAGSGTDGRPAWQAVAGLPVDGLRHAPDLTTPSLSAFADTVRALVRETGGRTGNLNPRLYQLSSAVSSSQTDSAATTNSARVEQAASSSTAGQALFEQTAPATRGTWTGASGLGVLNLEELLKLYPRTSSISTTTSLVSSSYALGYGDTFTLTSSVTPVTSGTVAPTGTVTFTSSTQGVLGSASINSGGTATLAPDVLPAGVYSITATYSGDGNYASSASTSNVTITVSVVNAVVVATIAPQTNVPYGATATVTATVKLPGAQAAPSGTVTAVIQAVQSSATATVSPNAGGTTATANIVLSAPPPNGSPYTVQVSCQGTSNYQCQSPVNLILTTVKGYTTTAVTATPAAPQAGEPISLTATVANSGNGTGTYTYTGSVSFYDSGKLLVTVPVATNQATTTLALSGDRTHNITATYTGDVNWNTSTSGAVAVTPTILPDELTLGSNVSSGTSLAGVNIIFSATATTAVTYGVGPTGTVSFFDTYNGTVLQLGNAAPLVANGTTASIARFTTTGLLAGTHSIYAVYSGDSNYAPSTSPVLQLSIADFALSMTPTSLTLSQGQSQQVTVLLGSSGGFTGTVSLGCEPPASSAATCGFSPSSLSSAGSTVLTISTTTATASLRQPPGWKRGLSSTLLGGSSLALVLWVALPGSRRRRVLGGSPLGLLALLVATGLTGGSLGCGLGVVGSSSDSSSSSGSSSGSGSGGTPLGTQNFTITAAASDGTNFVRHTYEYQVTVQ